jgi:hypothetical protein
MDRLEWYRLTLLGTTESVAARCGARTAGRAHLINLADHLRSGGHLDRDTRRKLKQWARRYRPKGPEDRLGHLVRTVVAAADLLQSLEAQAASPTTPILCNVARLAHFVGVEDPVVEALVPGQVTYSQAHRAVAVGV